MRILHTSDWHVGRTVSRTGMSRDEEHRAVFAEMTRIIKEERIDLVLVAGDVFDHQAPSAASEDIVYNALLGFTRAGAEVVLLAGNHDHHERIAAVRPLLKFARIHAQSKILPPDEGGCLELTLANGESARIALLPWPRRGQIIMADDLMHREAADQQSAYADRCRRVLETLCSGFRADTVNLVLAHLVVTGAIVGGGERASETVEDYWVPPTSLNLNAQYIALGHIHRRQRLPQMWQMWYSGSPLQLDFGEEQDVKGVLVFEATPGMTVRDPKFIELTGGRKMLTVRGSLQQLQNRAQAGDLGNAYLRVFVDEPARAGLADDVREVLPNAVQVLIEGAGAIAAEVGSREGMHPRQLMEAYFEYANVRDDDALKLFDELLEEEYASP